MMSSAKLLKISFYEKNFCFDAMFYPPTIPINILTFLIFSLFWGGVSFAYAWKVGDRSRDAWALMG
jgi:hypothetical protein